ncbi:putative DNA-binding domain-containing protein [Rhodanobacter ginsengisoli]|uniref:DNA-binding domain-containing protein n=1 Tax=Rhodanobacter ginsengisoli TaxID=418646 RepID=A0ABW0QRQ6_9GAMM
MSAPPSLSELQSGFARAMIDGAAPALLPWIDARGIAPAARLQIYRNAILATQVASLVTSFPAVERMLGTDCFDGWATRYAAWHGSRSGNLQNLGDDFADYLQAQPELSGLAWLGELTRLDWLRQRTILAADAEPLDAAALAAALRVAGDDPALHLLPCVHAMAAPFPLLDLWRYCESPETSHVNLEGGAQGVLLWREDGQVAMQSCTPAGVAFVAALKQGARVSVALAAAQALDAGAGIAALLGPVLTHALIHHVPPSLTPAENPA